MTSSVQPPISPSLGVTLGRTLDLAQRVAIDRLRLWQLELRARESGAARCGAAIGFGALCLAVAWVAAWAAALVALEPWLSLETRLVMLATAQLALGAFSVWAGLRSRRAVR
jgi:hypothetical protein